MCAPLSSLSRAISAAPLVLRLHRSPRPGRRPRIPGRVPPVSPRSPGAVTVLVLVLVVLSVGPLGACDTDPPGAPGTGGQPVEGQAVVTRVVDGDTVVALIGGDEEHVRLIGIDTPETKRPGTPVECFGPEASAHLGELLPEGGAVRLERDVEERDRYGRLLAYVHRLPDDLFVNRAMVAEGFAVTYPIAPNVARADELAGAARAARAAGLGLWTRCGGGHEPAPP